VNTDWQNRDSHTLILAGSNAGKTTLFKHMIANLLAEDCCVIVMDSQSKLIEELAHIKLEENDLTWISPEHNLALNPFDMLTDDLSERTIANKVSLLRFVIEHLMAAELTTRQNTLFSYVCELVLRIDGANAETFLDVLKDPYNYADEIDKLDETAQKFFYEDLRAERGRGKGNEYDSTRGELAYRIRALTSDVTFRRILQSEYNTFDVYQEMLDRKLILLDTSQAVLGDASPTFGRLLITQILQACYERVKNKETNRPVYFFIDEAHEYFDKTIENMVRQARKANVGMVLATQDFGRADTAGITKTLTGSTSTQFAAQVDITDARKLAPRMKTNADFLMNTPTHSFAFATGGNNAVVIKANVDALNAFETRSDLKKLRQVMEYHYGQENKKADAEEEADIEDEVEMSQNGDHDITPGAQL
ncbi:MAG: type IV secretory system conjugative DNA transfer family protein, partial [Pseudomonadota bacterium]